MTTQRRRWNWQRRGIRSDSLRRSNARKRWVSLLEELKTQGVAAPVVMMSGQAHIEMAVRATRLGALDFLEKPISTEKLPAHRRKRTASCNDWRARTGNFKQRLGKHEIIWQGEAMRRVMAQVERVAASETRVCVLGETGTGKELVARTLHERSARAAGPFVTLNCAAVPAELIESELFGHEKGSFTGAAAGTWASSSRPNMAPSFSDEIGDMPLQMQAKLFACSRKAKSNASAGKSPFGWTCAS